MLKFGKLTAVVLAAAIVLAMGSHAFAGRLSLSNQNFRVRWDLFQLLPREASTAPICQMTIEGSFHTRTITKIERLLLGYVTRADVNACTRGRMVALRETLPWHVRYRAFSGALPRIEVIRLELVNMALRVEIETLMMICLFRSRSEQPAQFDLGINRTTGEIETFESIPGLPIPLEESSGLFRCPNDGKMAGTATVRLLGSSTVKITVRLI